ncbi:LysR family transcriptional regulator [Xanthomonas phaseoli pv. phaseoli]|uniref:LysR family transcriptional regulator n=1 Tax=Xanthomonas TaxID=338 RepID=UPI0005368A3C|nr:MULTISPECIES: LysR family transcriptional regulator [Xanthomonas]MBV6839596.1 LysR family transcriptional regulator [Xanthomonas campestris pv. merremiae]ASK96804.1 LysR family transcriptional regulator [Xanthomonas citri pv. vignicola]KGU56922.1 LysR family transcriptional regulator [Xanthomonas phaseoli pv. phaseoli]KHF48418.1 LysR family transcriptional regulator [Xanthomonas phaseoli pv. phaseoli]KHS05431.1 LysR family transcriptional regulator [Xanthomonas phaseoli pv. phaseoli]
MARRTDFADLDAFVGIARAGGFRRAAALRGVSGSALSHAMRGLEERLGVRLFHRTSRSVSLTAAGEMLLAEVEPRFLGITDAVERLEHFREKPAGRVRVTALTDGARLLLTPKLPGFIAQYPDIDVEIVVDDRFIDMVAQGFDVGIRYGGTVPENMIATRLTRDLEWIVVGAPHYFRKHKRPLEPADLLEHRCIRGRNGRDVVAPWELGAAEEEVVVNVSGLLTTSDSDLSIRMAVAGVGLLYCLKDRVQPELDSGELEWVLRDWASPGPGFHAYYVSHRHVPSALRAFVEHMRDT